VGGSNDQLLHADDVADALRSATGMPLLPSSPIGAPDPEVAATLVGGNRSESVTALVFFDLKEPEQPLGKLRKDRVAGVDVVRRANVVVLYTRRLGAPNRLAAIRRAIYGLPLKG
jgi:hypothetical protein